MSEKPFGNSQSSYGAFSRTTTDQEGLDVEDLSRDISNKIFKINSQCKSLETLSKKLGTKNDNTQLRDRLHKTLTDTNEIVKEVPSLLGRLHNISHGRNQQLQSDRLRKSYKEAVEQYSSLQKKVTDKARSILLAATHEDDQVEDAWGEEAALLDQQRRKQELAQEQLQYEDELDINRDRAERIHQLESDILDVNVIFRDLAEQVHDQGTLVDSIENNVSVAEDNVEQGNVQLVNASNYQKSYRKKLLIFIIILIIFAGVLGVIIYVSIPKKKK